LSGLSETAVHNIYHVFKSYNDVKKRRYAVTTDRLINTHNIIGELTSEESDIVRFISVNQETNAAEIALFLEKDIRETKKILETMYLLGIIRKHATHHEILYSTV
jgi:hypothetical protein